MRNHPAATRTAIDAFWVLAIGVISAYAFFAALGAFSPSDVWGVTIGVLVLAALCALRVWIEGHHRAAERASRDPRSVQARERRGF
jgi:steroid 5-alpha reductase family enzyme